jgi:hypothetical protein
MIRMRRLVMLLIVTGGLAFVFCVAGSLVVLGVEGWERRDG